MPFQLNNPTTRRLGAAACIAALTAGTILAGQIDDLDNDCDLDLHDFAIIQANQTTDFALNFIGHFWAQGQRGCAGPVGNSPPPRARLAAFHEPVPPTWYKQTAAGWTPQNDFNADCKIDLYDYAHAQTWRHAGACASQAIRVIWYLAGPAVDLCQEVAP